VKGPRTLAIDVGASGLKAAVLDSSGRMVTERVRVQTPQPCPPRALVKALDALVVDLGPFDRVSVGFPGVVRNGIVWTAPNLGSSRAWSRFRLAAALERALGRQVRVANDADMQGLAAVMGTGIELVITLGTGCGTALFRDGELMPHLELGQHPVRGGKTYDQYVGDAARRQIGKRRWNRRVRRVIGILDTLVNYDRLHIGGGNASRLAFRLDRRTRVVSNKAGILGGVKLWKDRERPK
jgi:polyphosphate glucokinase